MSLETPRDLFIHELSDAMSAEHIVHAMLGELGKETQNDEVRKAVTAHQKETEQQIANLEKIFDMLGEKSEDTTCHAAEGLRKEHDSLKEEKPSELILELGNLAGAEKTEHYEIATYIMLQQMAKDLGEKDVEALLKKNLEQEKEMARTVQSLTRSIGKEAKKQMKEMEQAGAPS
jgi:ferritin-like metal-binding protein YciE